MINYRRTYAEIDLKRIYHNYKSVSDLVEGKTVIPVVKANAYGHGSVEIVRHLLKYDVNMYAVSLIEEADHLRRNFDDIDILIMGVTHPEDFYHCAKNNYTVTISNIDQVDGLMGLSIPLKVHLKVDTGMNRLGFKEDDEIKEIVSFLDTHAYVNLEGIFTHFATADGDLEYYQKQKERFEEILDMLPYKFDMVHCSNSSSSIKFEKDIPYTTHTRLGISLYGLTLDEDMDFLKPSYRLISHFQEIKTIKKGEKVGYGITYTASKDEVIGVLPLGYADGFIRKNQGGDVEIKGNRYQIVGRVCMDQIFVRIDSSITKNDPVILMGGIVTIDEVANRLDTINYEVVCGITNRVPKKHKRKE